MQVRQEYPIVTDTSPENDREELLAIARELKAILKDAIAIFEVTATQAETRRNVNEIENGIRRHR